METHSMGSQSFSQIYSQVVLWVKIGMLEINVINKKELYGYFYLALQHIQKKPEKKS